METNLSRGDDTVCGIKTEVDGQQHLSGESDVWFARHTGIT